MAAGITELLLAGIDRMQTDNKTSAQDILQAQDSLRAVVLEMKRIAVEKNEPWLNKAKFNKMLKRFAGDRAWALAIHSPAADLTLCLYVRAASGHVLARSSWEATSAWPSRKPPGQSTFLDEEDQEEGSDAALRLARVKSLLTEPFLSFDSAASCALTRVWFSNADPQSRMELLIDSFAPRSARSVQVSR